MHNTGIMHLWLYSSGRRYLRWSAPVMSTWNLVPQLVHDTAITEILKNILYTTLHGNTSLQDLLSWLRMFMQTTSCAGGRHNMPRPLQVDLWRLDLKSGVRVTCDVGYLYANFSLHRPLCFRLRPNICDRRKTDRRQTDRETSNAYHRLMPPLLSLRDADVDNRGLQIGLIWYMQNRNDIM